MTRTPLLAVDAANADLLDPTGEPDGHRIFPVRLGPDERPHLAPTSVKGMLRSAYEAITNSRFGVFADHDERLAYRMATRDGLRLVPARISEDRRWIELLPGTSAAKLRGQNRNLPLYGAWLPGYHPERLTIRRMPAHGDRIAAWIQRVERWARKPSGRWEPVFDHWRVVAEAASGADPGSRPSVPVDRDAERGRQREWRSPDIEPVSGYACVTGKNTDAKKRERLFFCKPGPAPRVRLEQRHEQDWAKLMRRYLDADARRDEDPARSPHLRDAAIRKLTGRTLCYADAVWDGAGYEVRALYPVAVPRALYAGSPAQALDRSLHPAEILAELSPADRVFGWASQAGQGAYRGNVRIGQVRCDQADAVEDLRHADDHGLPLAILAEPKAQQSRFYAARDQQGAPLGQGTPKKDAYPGQDGPERGGLRGRKVYPHQGLPQLHWQEPVTDSTQQLRDGQFQEYRRPQAPPLVDGKREATFDLQAGVVRYRLDSGEEQRDTQNRSITAWVKPDVPFSFSVHVTNLSDVELGALLYLLDLPPDHYHRLGGGKPLGFGSVRLDIAWEDTELGRGQDWAQAYRTLSAAPPSADRQALDACVDAYQQAVVRVYQQAVACADVGEEFERVSFIAAFLQAAAGFSDGLPVHYPRAYPKGASPYVPLPPSPDGMAYEWFVANEREGRVGPKFSLPYLVGDPGLPLLEQRRPQRPRPGAASQPRPHHPTDRPPRPGGRSR